ncbi:regulatory subunit of cyclin-dependent kinase [Mitosporidium daphniae]|uniref:Cyclin-dependent kinases regulatory subunit n=1 Tax=Mitosporidium daphniae TaxID=1485682 RepID=A0A098VW04_9MICR|nr:regulatory subunit of cyclin-dependent kinase [Mitosporidium daphniae]KGG51876.1 regulatory subunit of cyclin-dependent kinase [Mitosporidium daphniae]|eukprot:XP_013238312.1 regulatory subunit of cyclin-dependent kinase [Mitosporidium daphniae]
MVHFSGRILLLELQQKRKDVAEYSGDIFYSKRYSDDLYEYRLFVFPLFLGLINYFDIRHVILPKQLSKYYCGSRLLLEHEWRGLGIQQSPGWTHYLIHKPEPHILLFRRDKGSIET